MTPALELNGRNRADGGVPATRVVEALDVIEYRESGFTLILEPISEEQLAFEARVEASAHCIVVAIPDRSHRRPNAGLFAAVAKRDRTYIGTTAAPEG